jgi:hypothetical protein
VTGQKTFQTEAELTNLLLEVHDDVKKLRAEIATHRAALDDMDQTFKRIIRSPYFSSIALAQGGQDG